MLNQSEPQLITKPSFSVVGMLIRTQPMTPEIPKLWDKFVPRIDEIQNGLEPHVSYGLMDNFDQTGMDYMTAISVTQATEIPTDMTHRNIPANTYAVFETTIATVGDTFGYIFNTWLPGSNYRQSPAPYFERYGETFDPTSDPNFSIYIPVEKKS